MGPQPDPWRRFAGILAKGGLDDAQVENLLDAVGGVRELQLELRPFPIGIPWPDGLGVEVLIPRDRFDVLKDLLAVPGLQGIEIFPLGIVNPEVFRAVLSIR